MSSVTTGYIEAVVIPAGARRIRVVEDRPAHSFLGKTKLLHSKLLPYKLILTTRGLYQIFLPVLYIPLLPIYLLPGVTLELYLHFH